jgi:hypothetical protein
MITISEDIDICEECNQVILVGEIIICTLLGNKLCSEHIYKVS